MARLLKRCLEVCASHLWKILEKQKLIIIIKQKFQETHQFLLRKTGSERSENGVTYQVLIKLLVG